MSRNRIKNFREYLDDEILQEYNSTNIAFSPSFIGSSELAYQAFKNAEAAFLSKYVSRQYLDNTTNKDRAVAGYFVNDLRLRYNLPARPMRNIAVTLLVNNLFDELYSTNGYVYEQNYYFPQATRNFLLSLSLKF